MSPINQRKADKDPDLDDGIRDFWTGHDGICAHHAIRVFFSDL
jgi:hypothetical protein